MGGAESGWKKNGLKTIFFPEPFFYHQILETVFDLVGTLKNISQGLKMTKKVGQNNCRFEKLNKNVDFSVIENFHF